MGYAEGRLRTGANGKDDHSEVAGSWVEGGCSEYETKDCHRFADSDVPRAFVPPARTPGQSNSDRAGNKVWWASQSHGDVPAVAQSLDDAWEEVLESIARQVHVSADHWSAKSLRHR